MTAMETQHEIATIRDRMKRREEAQQRDAKQLAELIASTIRGVHTAAQQK